MDRLQGVGIELINDRIQIDTKQVRLIASGCINHILAVDKAVSTRST
jgi:hypothetical protein